MLSQFILRIAFMAAFLANMAAPAHAAQGAGLSPIAAAPVRLDTPSGQPVPRFVSLKSAKTFCRAGPSFGHRVQVTFLRKGLPVLIVAETTDHWRKLRDRDGDECWTHKSKLSGAETALVIKDGAALHTKPNDYAPLSARLGEGLIAEIEKSRGPWRRIRAGGFRGWIRASQLWGAGLDAGLGD